MFVRNTRFHTQNKTETKTTQTKDAKTAGEATTSTPTSGGMTSDKTTEMTK